MSTASNGETWKALMTERGWLQGSKFTVPEKHYFTINHTGTSSGYITIHASDSHVTSDGPFIVHNKDHRLCFILWDNVTSLEIKDSR